MKANDRILGADAQAPAPRRAREISRTLLIYGLLLGGALVFTLPFIWIIGTSFKVDREIFSERLSLFPMRPVPAAKSPYLDRSYFRDPPDPRYAQVAPLLHRLVVESAGALPDSDRMAPAEWAETLERGLFLWLRDRLPAQVWNGSPAARLTTFLSGATRQPACFW